jgi:hypothetical protein
MGIYLTEDEYELLRRVAYEHSCKLNDVAREAIKAISGQMVVIASKEVLRE